MSSFFNDDFFHPITSPSVDHHRSPSVNISEDDKEYTIEAVLAGMTKTDIQLDINENLLSIVAERKDEQTTASSSNEAEVTEEVKFTLKEFSIRKYKRSFRLPKNVNQKNIYADFKNGILTVTIPKEEHKKIKAKSIKIS